MTYQFAMSQIQSTLMMNGDSIKVDRPTGVHFVDGKPVTGERACFYVNASVQPLSGREISIQPEGDRFKEQINIYTDKLMLVGDLVTYNDARWHVQNVETWPGYFKAKAMRIDAGPHANP